MTDSRGLDPAHGVSLSWLIEAAADIARGAPVARYLAAVRAWPFEKDGEAEDCTWDAVATRGALVFLAAVASPDPNEFIDALRDQGLLGEAESAFVVLSLTWHGLAQRAAGSHPPPTSRGDQWTPPDPDDPKYASGPPSAWREQGYQAKARQRAEQARFRAEQAQREAEMAAQRAGRRGKPVGAGRLSHGEFVGKFNGGLRELRREHIRVTQPRMAEKLFMCRQTLKDYLDLYEVDWWSARQTGIDRPAGTGNGGEELRRQI